jgi:PAS domain S-box-containing protein
MGAKLPSISACAPPSSAIRDVSEQRRAERERLQQADRLRLQTELLSLAHDAIFVRDLADRVTFWNGGAQELYGWTEAEAQGRVTHNLLRTIFPESLDQLDELLARGGHWEGELVHTCRDGSVVVVESRQALVRDGRGQPTAILEINRDITRRRQLEQAAQAAHTRTMTHLSLWQQILDALPSSVYLVYGPEARLLLANQATRRVWGASWSIGQPLGEFLAAHRISVSTAQGLPLALEAFATLRTVGTGETVRHHQETIRRPDGSLLSVLVNAVVLDTATPWNTLQAGQEGSPSVDGSERVALVVHQDVNALKEADHLKDEFIGMAAHELRNPLAALKGFADMLVYHTARGKGPTLADWQQEAIEMIEEATARLDKLTEDLLDVTRLQAGRLALSRASTDLVALVRQQVRQAQIATQRHTISFETSLSKLQAQIDHVRIEQVLSNLLSNAIKYSPQGGLIEVVLREESEPHAALLSVRDQGIGIPASQRARIFGRFMRAENARTTEIAGTGLGLYLSREMIERHGGRLWFESTEGVGSTFTFSLPIS